LEGNNYSPILYENVVEMGEMFFHSFQRRESLRGDGGEKKRPIPKEKKIGSKINKRIKYPPKL